MSSATSRLNEGGFSIISENTDVRHTSFSTQLMHFMVRALNGEEFDIYAPWEVHRNDSSRVIKLAEKVLHATQEMRDSDRAVEIQDEIEAAALEIVATLDNLEPWDDKPDIDPSGVYGDLILQAVYRSYFIQSEFGSIA